jgi:hypothetical protein
MGYYIDLGSVTLDEYREKLRNAYLLPSRRILKESIDLHFDYFKNIGIANVKQLQQILKKKGTIEEMSKNSLSAEYLTILLREINSLHPKPNKITEFTTISQETANKLEKAGIKDTVTLFDRVKSKKNRIQLAAETSVDEKEIEELTRLTDLSRIKWVGAAFARVLYEAGFDSSEKVSKADYNDLYNKITALNRERNLYKGNIGLNDMQLCVLAARDVSPEIEF